MGFECILPSTSVDFHSSVLTSKSNDSLDHFTSHGRPQTVYDCPLSLLQGFAVCHKRKMAFKSLDLKAISLVMGEEILLAVLGLMSLLL